MRVTFRIPLRHPFYPEWVATPARAAEDECDVLSGSFPELAQAAANGVRARVAVFALQHPDTQFLTDYERDVLWETFQVPVLGFLLDRKGVLVGWECEAQEGLHLGSAWSESALWVCRLRLGGAVIDHLPCECGRPGKRLLRPPATRIPVPGPGREAQVRELQAV
jgi:hypothetical protein